MALILAAVIWADVTVPGRTVTRVTAASVIAAALTASALIWVVAVRDAPVMTATVVDGWKVGRALRVRGVAIVAEFA